MEREGKGRRIIFSAEEDAYIREHYPTGTAGDIGDHFGISAYIITKRAKELGLKKVEGWSKDKFQKRYVKDYQYGNYVPYLKTRV